ncbi:hypothetical protein [Neotabrizicola shimadae]|uniref:Uncharacterized protein n=1 Tax=Neotabrizicola shimadae TaxID=2807096 RepID=A0A8G1ECY8_9RHOB|nr:hypothetical protein [Neotabrizicola shimadae]QYZ68834.1 hypothetical protein JO391_13815 [Neotabrizicola shimadae]
MLRKIISLYKAVFLIMCGLMLASALGFGFYGMIEGQTSRHRWDGVSLMVGGALFVLMLAGNFALVLENNELLRRIAEQGEREQHPSQTQRPNRPEQRSEPMLRRREPTL